MPKEFSPKLTSLFGVTFSTLSWWICVLGGRYIPTNYQLVSFGVFIFLSLLSHQILFFQSTSKKFWLFYLGLVTVGLLGDGLFFFVGLLKTFSENDPTFLLFPYWLLALWLVFPLNFLHSFKKFLETKKWGILFGAVGGPLAYGAGPKFEILKLGPNSLVFVGIFWALYFLFANKMYESLNFKHL